MKVVVGIWLLWIFCVGKVGAESVTATNGLLARFTAGGVSDALVVSNVWIFVPSGQPATPFLPPGNFQAEWQGALLLGIRSEYTFHAECQGDVKVLVNDAVALEGKGDGKTQLSGKSIRLNKGANRLTVAFTPPASGDAFLRLFWSNKETPFSPIPTSQLGFRPTELLAQSRNVREGRDLFLEHRCVRCHAGPSGLPELSMDAPAFDGIGSRRNPGWLAQWIANPRALRSSAHMPQVFNGPDATKNSEAVAAFLGSLKGPELQVPKPGEIATGKAWFNRLHCERCHGSPEAKVTLPQHVSQKQVKAKFPPGALVAFLLKPSEHFAWIRMPDFKLAIDEASHLATYLESVAEPASSKAILSQSDIIELGRKLVGQSGCLNCHSLKDARNEFAAPALKDLSAQKWNRGCMEDAPAENSKAPRFEFNAEQRSALRAFAATDRKSLDVHHPADFVERMSDHLNCKECHGPVDGIPNFEWMGEKLKPEWMARFIAGDPMPKPRPWLEARMPAFPAYAKDLSEGLAMSHGLPSRTPPDPLPPNAGELVAAGQKLVSANGGFSCIACHGAGEFMPTQVFEAPGINLAYSYDRLQRSYYERWLRSPMSIEPTTKMPLYFDEEGRSPLTEVLDGDGPKTIQAIWEFLRLGEKMPRPE